MRFNPVSRKFRRQTPSTRNSTRNTSSSRLIFRRKLHCVGNAISSSPQNFLKLTRKKSMVPLKIYRTSTNKKSLKWNSSSKSVSSSQSDMRQKCRPWKRSTINLTPTTESKSPLLKKNFNTKNNVLTCKKLKITTSNKK